VGAQVPAGILAKQYGGKVTISAALFGGAALLGLMPAAAGLGITGGTLGRCGAGLARRVYLWKILSMEDYCRILTDASRRQLQCVLLNLRI
jgi:hypothetical protein